MAKLPPLKRVLSLDLSDAPKWFTAYLGIANNFFQNLWNALDHNLTLQDNVRSQIVEVGYVGGSELSLSTTLGQPLIGIVVLQVQGPPVTAAVFLNWEQIGQVINIKEVFGLTAGERYKLRLLFV